MAYQRIRFLSILVLVFSLWRVQAMSTSRPDESRNETSNETNETRKTTDNRKYLYGSLSVALVSILSLLGVIVIPFVKQKQAYDGVMLTFMALAVGTMTSDALLHLIPETLGLDHDEDNKDSDKKPTDPNDWSLGKMICLLATLYGLYLLELTMHTIAKLVRKPKVTQTNGEGQVKMLNGEKEQSVEIKWASNIGHHGHSHAHSHQPQEEADAGHTILGLKSVAFVVVLSDAMHNFTDGLAIGAAFSKSFSAGLGITIAVVCHEIPHEIGNFAILLNTGMSLKKALLLNFLSAVTAFAGLYPGLIAGEQEVLARWIFAAVAAGFLYVALVHMLRELQHFGSLPWYLTFILQNMGMLVGFVVIYLLAIYEHDLNEMG